MATCEARTYEGVDKPHAAMLLDGLKAQGATVTGNNPYDVDTHKQGVKLRATYNEPAQKLTVEVTDRPSVPFVDVCAKVWDQIDPAIQKVLSTPAGPTPSDPNAAAAGKIVLGRTPLSQGTNQSVRSMLDGLDKLAPQPKTAPAAASAGGALSNALGWVKQHPYMTAGGAVAILGGLGFWYWKARK